MDGKPSLAPMCPLAHWGHPTSKQPLKANRSPSGLYLSCLCEARELSPQLVDFILQPGDLLILSMDSLLVGVQLLGLDAARSLFLYT